MEFFAGCLDFIIHLDKHLNVIVQQYGVWAYIVFFLIIFAETGLVVTPFLPGDSLLFMLGALASQGTFHPLLLAVILICAAILGDSVNYLVGKYLGDRLLKAKRVPFFKKEHFDRTHEFYQKYGGKTIVLARFMPIIRTFAPFVAGLGDMDYAKFLFYNVTGGILWVTLFVFGGFYFGNIPVVKNNFSVVTLVIIGISVMPIVIELVKARSAKVSGAS